MSAWSGKAIFHSHAVCELYLYLGSPYICLWHNWKHGLASVVITSRFCIGSALEFTALFQTSSITGSEYDFLRLNEVFLKKRNTFKRVINHLNLMDAMLHFGICLKRCELFIKASHVGNNFLSALTPFLNLHLDRKMIPSKLFIMSIHPL